MSATILKTFLTQAEFNDHALLRAPHAMRTQVLLSFERILSFPSHQHHFYFQAKLLQPRPDPDKVAVSREIFYSSTEASYNNKSVLRVSFSLICHSGNISNETKRETEKNIRRFFPLSRLFFLNRIIFQEHSTTCYMSEKNTFFFVITAALDLLHRQLSISQLTLRFRDEVPKQSLVNSLCQ